MDPASIKPFVQSVQNVFSTMLQLPLTIGEPTIKNDDEPTYDVSGIIGMSGDVVGSVVLSFPKETAERVVALFTGLPPEEIGDNLPDAVGELVNMVSGGAKGQFQDRKVSISCPSVVIGANHKVARPKDVPCIAIPCESDCGAFAVEVALQDRKPQSQQASAAAAQA